jgi:hypothetical protein
MYGNSALSLSVIASATTIFGLKFLFAKVGNNAKQVA